MLFFFGAFFFLFLLGADPITGIADSCCMPMDYIGIALKLLLLIGIIELSAYIACALCLAIVSSTPKSTSCSMQSC